MADEELAGDHVHGRVERAIQVGRARDVTVFSGPPPEPTRLDRLADSLAEAVTAQWETAARERGLLEPEHLPIRWRRSDLVAGPVSTATATDRLGRFAPLPGIEPVTADRLVEGDHHDLFAVYGGLPSGRLVITGEPGAGKSSAAILLLLAALEHRRACGDPRVPVPVLLTLQKWDPGTTPVHDWLAAKLAELQPLAGRRGTAAGQADRGLPGRLGRDPRVAQGDSASAARPVRGLPPGPAHPHRRAGDDRRSAAERRRAGDPTPDPPRDAVEYLRRNLRTVPPEEWRALLDALADESAPLSRAARSPLVISLLRDAYPLTDIDALGGLPTVDAVTTRLLDQAVPLACTGEPGRPRPPHSEEEARAALSFIARRLGAEGSRDFAWWTAPTWVPGARHQIREGLITGLLLPATFSLPFRFLTGGLPSGDGRPAGVTLLRCLPRGLLRTVGPVYQFRHALLRDLLADEASPQR
ncbi:MULTISPECIES: hypothetical protein [Actinosynnema]|uniref:hypothetical protein n=1 Tax=Actinosynnema TaxID=40566 RepID=UPI0020A308C3|nr:hypothetical protein [Actinosynnema pretiosum]MCP2099574.1 hypothetical protein [Actinosynnema pretiosum]